MWLAGPRCVDMWAPGADIMSASHLSDVATEYRSGTSQAVPFVAGAAALYLENVTGAALSALLFRSSFSVPPLIGVVARPLQCP